MPRNQTLCLAVLALLPVASRAEVAGDWSGILNLPLRTLHFVLHVTGPDNALKATSDSPDQKAFNNPVNSISFSGSTLRFAIERVGVTYSGDLTSDGTIVGTFTQGTGSVPLVLTRVANLPQPPPPANGPSGELSNGLYHHNATGVDLPLPPGWSVGPSPVASDPSTITLLDPEHRPLTFTVVLTKYENPPERLPASLNIALNQLMARRAGQNGPAAAVPNYKIREGTVEHTTNAVRPGPRTHPPSRPRRRRVAQTRKRVAAGGGTHEPVPA